MSLLYINGDSSSIQNESAPFYKTFEQELNSLNAPSLGCNTCEHELDDSEKSFFDTKADVNLCADLRFSPSLSSSMNGHDVSSLKQTDRRSFEKKIPNQYCMHCML